MAALGQTTYQLIWTHPDWVRNIRYDKEDIQNTASQNEQSLFFEKNLGWRFGKKTVLQQRKRVPVRSYST
jgi:hypothetical protein